MTDTPAHTSGEWKAWRSPQGWTVRAVYHDSQGRRVTCWPAFCDAGAQPNEANAHLIAAAPDMLAALKSVVRVAGRATDEFDAARAAIAKAEAKEPTP